MPWNKGQIDSMGITQLVAGIKLFGGILVVLWGWVCIAVYGECGRAFCNHGVKRVWGLQWSLGHGFIGVE